ncbi:hypothetical protein Gotur_016363 [Gossypium turneri]
MVLHGMFHVLPMPYPRYGLTWEFSYRCPCHVLDMVLQGTSHLGDAKAMSQTWSYMGCLMYCQCHIPDMVLHESSHIGAHAMSQTWSYGGPLI